jgi:hypothetical protein
MFSKKQRVKCIDFDYSSIAWKTKRDSLGIFRIDAVLREKKTNRLNYLAKTVMAGNVYSTSILPIIPNYNFQWLTNGKKRVIFRTFANNKIKIDTKNNKNINKYLLNIRYKKKREIFIENFTNNYKFFNKLLVCKIDLGNQISEFPIKHINIHTKNNNFQVETGPILLKKNKKFISAFIFFNSINKCQIVPYYPKLGSKIEVLKAKIKFFINA